MWVYYSFLISRPATSDLCIEKGGRACEIDAGITQIEGWASKDRHFRGNLLSVLRTKPLEHLNRWCGEASIPLTCTALAYEHADADALKRACELGDVEACGPHGYFAFDAASPDEKTAIQARVLDACERGGGAACAAYARNTRVSPEHGDPATAIAWAHIACIGNYDGWACAEASWLRESLGRNAEARIPGCQNSDAVPCDADPTLPASFDALEYPFERNQGRRLPRPP